MNIVEQIIIVAAHELLSDYHMFVNADTSIDGGEHSSDRDVPSEVSAAYDLVTALEADEQGHSEYACPGCGCEPGDGYTDGCDDPAGCGYFTCDAAKYPDGC